MKYILLLLLLSSCSRHSWEWVIQETKISTMGKDSHIEAIGKPVPIGDTTIRGYLITKRKN